MSKKTAVLARPNKEIKFIKYKNDNSGRARRLYFRARLRNKNEK